MKDKGCAADFIGDLQWADLPEATRRRVKLCLLDGLGVALAGTMTEVSKIAAAYATCSWRGDEAAILLHGCRASAAGAAFANAHSANALDLDDDAIFTRGHPGAQLVPTVLAIGEDGRASGQSLLTALVCGYEMAIRTGCCWHEHHETYQACGSWGSVAWGHAAGVAALGLVEKHNIKPEEIKKVRVKTFTEAAALFRDLPSTTEEAQFSIRWPLACLLVDRCLKPEHVLGKRLSDPRVKNLFGKIEIVLDHEIDQIYKRRLNYAGPV